MRIKYLQCVRCGHTYPKDVVRYRCDCGDSLEIVYDYSTLHATWEDSGRAHFATGGTENFTQN